MTEYEDGYARQRFLPTKKRSTPIVYKRIMHSELQCNKNDDGLETPSSQHRFPNDIFLTIYIPPGHHAICCPSSPPRSARRARTSETHWRPSRSGTRCNRSLSVGSLIHPWIGMALSFQRGSS